MSNRISNNLTALLLLCFVAVNANAGEILFAFVDDYVYQAEGNELSSMLQGTGYTVTTRDLSDAVYNDYNSFDQIFVYDLSARADNSATQVANYAGIADWYNNRTDQNLILDGRIISSSTIWTGLGSNPLGPGAEVEYIQNYRDQLNLRGGGLVLGTDHATAFTQGINQINAGIGVNPFTGFYFTRPLEAYVDPLSPLHVPELKACVSDPSQQCINNNSSTSFVATGLQANGQVLTPVAYHGGVTDAFELAAVSTTMGSITFGTCGGPGQPACSVPEPSPLALIGLGLLGLRLSRKFKPA